jgi:hypothetical protein
MLRAAKHLARAARGLNPNDASEMLRCTQHDVLLYFYKRRLTLLIHYCGRDVGFVLYFDFHQGLALAEVIGAFFYFWDN